MSVNLDIIISGNDLPPLWHHTITWTKANSLSTDPLGTDFSEILIFNQRNAFQNSICKMIAILFWVWYVKGSQIIFLWVRRHFHAAKSWVYISIALCKTTVTPLLMQWSYCSLALSPQYAVLNCFNSLAPRRCGNNFRCAILVIAKCTIRWPLSVSLMVNFFFHSWEYLLLLSINHMSQPHIGEILELNLVWFLFYDSFS